MTELEILRRKLEREKAARVQAEHLLEEKSLDLFKANSELKRLNTELQQDLERKSLTLERQKIRIQQLVDDAADIIYIASPEGLFLYVNPVATRIVEYAEEELIGKHYTELIRPDYVERVQAFYKANISSKESSYLEFPIRAKSGKEVWIGQRANAVERDGKVVRINAIARDITKEKLAKKELSRLYLQLKTILENLQEGILMEDEHGQIVAANKKFCEIFQLETLPEDLVGTSFGQFAQQVKNLFTDPEGYLSRRQSLLQNKTIAMHDTLTMVNGAILERDFIPIFTQDGYNGQIWHYEDVTERKLTEEKIRRSEEKFRSIIENMDLGILEVDALGVIVKPYPRYCQMTGYAAEELIGQKAAEVLLNEESKSIMEEHDRRRLTGVSDSYELAIKKKSGELMWVLIGGAPISNQKGEVVGSIGIHFDLTEHKRLQEELEIARFEAEKARDSEKEFLANMSHEIRNPIHSIIGMINLLYDTHLTLEQLDYVKTIKYSSEILMALVSDILDLSKIVAGKMELAPQLFDLKEMLQVIGKTIEIRLLEKPVEFESFIDPHIPANVVGDSTFINQILLNLLGNAVKFTEKGVIRLEGRLDSLENDQVWIQFVISDSGIGIPMEKLPVIFERFSQAGKTTKSKYGGTGLGLPITKQLIELHGGSIHVESEPDHGSVFHFRIPFRRSDLSNTQKKEPHLEIPTIPIANRKMRILIVEDNPVNRRYLESVLTKWNCCTFWSAGDGVEALEILHKEVVDLILMDIRMPRMDGYETAIHLRNMTNNPNSSAPIIALTASALLDEREKVLKAGMNYHLTKPFTPEQLLSTIRLFCGTGDPTESLPSGEDHYRFSSMFDVAELDELYLGDLETAQILFEIFVRNTPNDLVHLEEAVASRDLKTMSEIAHKIKPTFAMVGLGHIEAAARELELAGREQLPEKKVRDIFFRFSAAARRAVELVSQELHKIDLFLQSQKKEEAASDR
ncbi:MAG: PAS domain S-box protein [Haliscomenobacter sp.]|nr:PAS domain S-box protein [Haliscomenobacter sp.]